MFKTPKRVLSYAKENYNGVMHTTINPEGPGVVRLHLIPPRIDNDRVRECIAIINGQDIIPVNTTWSIILCELIKEVNKYSGHELTEAQTQSIIDNTVAGVRRVFPFIFRSVIRKDIVIIMRSLTAIAYGDLPDEKIEYMDLGTYAPYMRAPHRMDLLVSAMTRNGVWHCNQKCVHCYAAGQELGNEEELSTDEWKRIIDRCREACIPQVTFTGGEPTLREDLPELIDHAKWFVTRLNTNGIKLTREYCEQLRSVSLDSCQITFYSHDEKIHNRLVGADHYRDTLSGIRNALAAGLSVSINTPLCTMNRDYTGTLKFLKELGIEYVTCSGLIVTGNALTSESEELQLSSDELRAVLREASDFCGRNGMEISFTSPGWIDDACFEELGINRPTCGACLSNMAVSPGGNVIPCQSWMSGRPLGNMLKDDWDSIWNGTECSNHRAYSAMLTGTCPLKESAESKAGAEAGSAVAAGTKTESEAGIGAKDKSEAKFETAAKAQAGAASAHALKQDNTEDAK